MNFRSCPYEREIKQVLADGHWPDGCDRGLRAHVEQCGSCGDIVLVTEVFQKARAESAEDPTTASASLLWWRAQLRRRYAAEEKVSKPITIAQTFAWVVTLLVAIVFAASQYQHGLHWASWWPELERSLVSVHWPLATKFGWNLLLLIPGLGILALLSGVVLYLVSEKQ